MRKFLAGLALVLCCSAGPVLTVGGTRLRVGGTTITTYRDAGTGDGGYNDAGVIDLNGFEIPLALQCTGATVYTESPRQAISHARSSSGYCTKSDGTVVLLGTNVPRRERTGLLIERNAVNLIGTNGDKARDLSDAAWTKTNMTCVKNATGIDGTANSASTCTATAGNATVTYAVTVASAKRASSAYIKGVTVTGAVDVTRNNFSTVTNVGPSLSTSTFQRARADCGGYGDDIRFSTIDNCIAASNLTATAANPTVGVRLVNSGDSVVIDAVQDEATEYATSPMLGFARARDIPTIASVASLPVAAGELSLDWVLERAYGVDTSGFAIAGHSTGFSGGGVMSFFNNGSGNWGFYVRNSVSGPVVVAATTGTFTAGQGKNQRLTWGDTNKAYVWRDGIVLASSAAAPSPDVHSTPYGLGDGLGDETQVLGGWLARVRWTAGTVGSFKGSSLLSVLIGDSIVEGVPASDTNRPQQVFSTLIGGGRAMDRYVVNLGGSGLTVDGCKTNWDAQIAAAVAAGNQSQTVMVLQCGVNSEPDGAAAVYAKIEQMLESGLDAGVKVLPSTLTPCFVKRVFLQAVNTSIRNWGIARGVKVAETYAALEDPGTPNALNPAMSSGDGLHPNTLGSVTMTTVWFNTGRDAGYY